MIHSSICIIGFIKGQLLILEIIMNKVAITRKTVRLGAVEENNSSENNEVVKIITWKRKLMLKALKYGGSVIVVLIALYFGIIEGYKMIVLGQNWLDSTKEFYRVKAVQLLDGKTPDVEMEGNDAGTRSKRLTAAVNYVAKKYSLNPVVIWAVIEKESGYAHNRIRFEQTWKDQYSKKWQKEPWMNDIEYDMYFTSFGYMQIGYGLWRESCGIKYWDELLNVERNIDCGAKILANCIGENSGKVGVLRGCFRQFNGSGERAEKYANDIMNKLEGYMTLDMEQVSLKKMEARDQKMQVSLNKVKDDARQANS